MSKSKFSYMILMTWDHISGENLQGKFLKVRCFTHRSSVKLEKLEEISKVMC